MSLYITIAVRLQQLFACLCLGVCLVALGAGPVHAEGFKFGQPTEDDLADQAAEQERQDRIYQQLSTPCRAALKDRKIMVIIGERQAGGLIRAQQQSYSPHFQAINSRLQGLGLRTYTQAQIQAQIKQAEIDAYFRNDPDAALSASRRLGASFILRGLISSQASRNPMIPVNQVSVDMNFTLTDASGRTISEASANSSSYAGTDVSRMALTLVNEKADEVVGQLYADYCRNAAPGRPAKK